jgi:hypothetical protein
LPAAASNLVSSFTPREASRPATPIPEKHAGECLPAYFDCDMLVPNQCCPGHECAPEVYPNIFGRCVPKKTK